MGLFHFTTAIFTLVCDSHHTHQFSPHALISTAPTNFHFTYPFSPHPLIFSSCTNFHHTSLSSPCISTFHLVVPH
jgi:hypothetical protein